MHIPRPTPDSWTTASSNPPPIRNGHRKLLFNYLRANSAYHTISYAINADKSSHQRFVDNERVELKWKLLKFILNSNLVNVCTISLLSKISVDGIQVKNTTNIFFIFDGFFFLIPLMKTNLKSWHWGNPNTKKLVFNFTHFHPHWILLPIVQSPKVH